MWSEGIPRGNGKLHAGGNQTFSYVGVCGWKTPGRCAVSPSVEPEDRMHPAMSSRARRICLAIALLATAGTLVSVVSLYHHYQTDKTSYCDLGENFNCDIVNRSSYSVVLGVPVALIGVLG